MSAIESEVARQSELDEVAARYAVAVTPVLDELIAAESGCGPVSRQFLPDDLRGRVSGICQPTYVLDVPGGHGKSPIGPSYVRNGDAGETEVCDVQGRWHRYPPT